MGVPEDGLSKDFTMSHGPSKILHYRPGQPDWEFTMWKCQDISATQILREINFGYFEVLKTAILTILAALDFVFLGTFDISSMKILPKMKIQSLQNCYNKSF